MTRILIHVEGQTEETFVNEVLAPHLYAIGYHSVGARLVGNARQRYKRGGITAWHVTRQEIERHLAADANCIATTMVDYYALPTDWPGRLTAASLPYDQRGSHIREEIWKDFQAFSQFHRRFEPFVLMHEFEALLFSDCVGFAIGIGHPAKAAAFQSVSPSYSAVGL